MSTVDIEETELSDLAGEQEALRSNVIKDQRLGKQANGLRDQPPS